MAVSGTLAETGPAAHYPEERPFTDRPAVLPILFSLVPKLSIAKTFPAYQSLFTIFLDLTLHASTRTSKTYLKVL